MKFVTIVASLVCIVTAYAQKEPAPAPKTQLQVFEAQTGAVIVKGFSEIGTVVGMGSVSIDAREFLNASNSKREFGIAIEVKEQGRLDREDTSLIDYDEIDSLLAGIDYVKAITHSVTKLKNFEASYRTRGDFAITVFSSNNGKIDVAVSSGRIGRTTAYIGLDKLASLRAVIVAAKQQLDAIRQ